MNNIASEILKCLEPIKNESLPESAGPFFVYDWIQEKYPNEVEVIAKGMFGGKVIIIPTNKGEIK